jgi:hypothetical protein
MMKIRGGRALDELTGSNRGKIRLISRAGDKKYGKGKRNGSRHRAERVVIVHEMAIKEARNTDVKITRTEKGRYGNAHIMYRIRCERWTGGCGPGSDTNGGTANGEDQRAKREKERTKGDERRRIRNPRKI